MRTVSLSVRFFLAVTLLTVCTITAADPLTLKQKILMPGPLIQGHADIESDCESCHSPFSKQSMTDRCLDCHDDIRNDRLNARGFHGNDPAAKLDNCETCHTDHEGRETDITGLLPDTFNHRHTGFDLTGSHRHLHCADCHQPGQTWREAVTSCSGCHADDDIHQGELGKDCAQCHQTTQWTRQKPFDHSSTDFPLVGGHRDVLCLGCHVNQQFQLGDQRCVSCHRANDVHSGNNGDDCASCHTDSGWSELKFDHNKTDFPLLDRHGNIPCQACHAPNSDRKKTPSTCNSCHSNDDIHLGRNGTQCQQCHSAATWSEVKFHHDSDTDFPLTGSHRKLECTQCHTGTLDDPLSRECRGCHKADDIHNDASMALCGTCHNTTHWGAVSQFDHDLSEFPLLGMHRLVPCQDCHVGNQFNLASDRCVACHRQDDTHSGGLGEECGQCHTPNAWQLWVFKHDQQTDFSLTGKHQGLQCSACHKPGSDPGATPQLCGNCHRQQDIHNGEFGERCERCHTTTNFFDLTIE